MGYGFRYGYGPRFEDTGIPASGFSKGDALMLTSASSLSRLDDLLAGDVCGVAMSDSNASLNAQVPYVKPHSDTVFVSACTIGSQFTEGEELDLEYTGGRHFVSTSANTPRVVVRLGSTDYINSNTSEILTSFIGHSGLIEYS